MVGPRPPTSPVTAQLIFRRWKIFSICYCADFEQRTNERMVVLPQTHSCSFHGVEKPFGLDRMKRFKNIRTYGWAVLPETQPISFHGVENFFFLHGMKLFKNIRTYGWVVIPQLQPSHVHGVEYPFRLDVLQPFENIQVYGGAAFPNIPVTAQLISRR